MEPEKKQASSILINKGAGTVVAPREANNSKNSPAGKNAISPSTINDPRVELRGLRDFLERNGFQMRAMPSDMTKRHISSSTHDGAFFYITQNQNDFTFHWESHNHDEDWFKDRKTTISESFPGSRVDTLTVCRLWVPVDQNHYRESILKIINKTKGIMGY
jgi:hypothetical protein